MALSIHKQPRRRELRRYRITYKTAAEPGEQTAVSAGHSEGEAVERFMSRHDGLIELLAVTDILNDNERST